jgi:hypothetical protein
MKINKLSQYQLYKLIFNPIFDFEVKYPESWNEKDIINKKKLPDPFIIDDEDEAYLEYEKEEKRILEGFNGAWYQLSSVKINELKDIKNNILEKYYKYEDIQLPKFSIKTYKKDECVKISLDYLNYVSVRNNIFSRSTRKNSPFEIEEDKDMINRYYLIFHRNGDIETSNYTVKERGVGNIFNRSTVTEYENTPRFLSYTETLNMNEYMKKNNIEIF